MSTTPEEIQDKKETLNFIEQIVKDDLAAGRNGGRLQTRSARAQRLSPHRTRQSHRHGLRSGAEVRRRVQFAHG